MDTSIQILYELSLLMKHRRDAVVVSSSDFGRRLGVSQQSASRYLCELEEKGLIERTQAPRGQAVRMTDKGAAALSEMCASLRAFLNVEEARNFKGLVSRGLGEGAYYVKEYSEKLRDDLGFEPFPGTLNVRSLDGPLDLRRFLSGRIDAFTKEGRSFGSLLYAAISLRKDGREERCFVVAPERTHHSRDVLEIVGGCNLREKMGLSDGDLVDVLFL